MRETTFLSRRAAFGSLMASSLLVMPASASSSTDAHLLALGLNFDEATAKFDQAIADGCVLDWPVLDELRRLDVEIAATQASTVEGLRVKARAACWALLGDLDPLGEPTLDTRMALSIVRDLIRLYDPALERPGALKELVEDIESGAGNYANCRGV
jgi:hypothetical protein